MVFFSQRNQESQNFLEGKEKKITWCHRCHPFHHHHTPGFFEPPVPPTIQAHGTSPPTQGRREGEGFLGSLCMKQMWRAGSLLSPPVIAITSLLPRLVDPIYMPQGGEGCVCGSRMTTPQKTKVSFHGSKEIFNFFFFFTEFFSIFLMRFHGAPEPRNVPLVLLILQEEEAAMGWHLLFLFCSSLSPFPIVVDDV